jgi:hypothetical protein
MRGYLMCAAAAGLSLASQLATACPAGQHSECLIPKPRPLHGCAQSICVPNVENPVIAMTNAINDKAVSVAIEGRDNEKIRDREDCMILVTASLGAWGASLGGPWVGLVTGAAGGAASSMACRKAFPLE